MITDDYSTDDWLLIVMIHHLSDLSIWNSNSEIRTCSRASTFWLRFSWRSKLWSLTWHLASTGHLAGLDVLDGLSHRQSVSSNDGLRLWRLGIYAGMAGNLWESPRKTTCWNVIWDTVEICWNATVGIRTVGWMLFFTSSLARFNLGKCVIRGLRCGHYAGSDRAHAIPLRWSRPKWFHHPLQCPSQRNKTKVSKSNGRMECSYFKGSESHRITWLSWFIPVSRIFRIYLSVPADFQSPGFDLLKICTVRSWQK